MARDCEVLSANAKAIFEKFKPFFPPDPWGNPRLWEDGRIKDNWDYDLKKSADRERLKEWYEKLIGGVVVVKSVMRNVMQTYSRLGDISPRRFHLTKHQNRRKLNN